MTAEHNNPPIHDQTFKWLLTAFTEEFFACFWPNLRIGRHEIIDKEFIEKFVPDKSSLEGDLFLIMEVEIDGLFHEIVILLELKSEKVDVREKLYDYFLYASIMRRRPVWCIVFYSDDAHWRTPLPDSFPIGFTGERGLIQMPYDIIKLKDFSSAELIRKPSLLAKVLALKANDAGCDREQLVHEIFTNLKEHYATLTDEQKLSAMRCVKNYAGIPTKRVTAIRKEVGMVYTGSTITEHIRYEAEQIGEKRGEKRGEIRGIQGQIAMLQEFHDSGLIPTDIFKQRLELLQKQLGNLGLPDTE